MASREPAIWRGNEEEGAGMTEEPNRRWVGTPLDTDDVDPRGIEEIVVEFDEGEEVLTPQLNERFGSYDLHEAAAYVHFLSGHISKGREG